MDPQRPIGMEIKTVSNLIRRTLDLNGHREYVESITGTNAWIIGFLAKNERQGKDVFQKDIEERFMIRRSTVSSIIQLMEKKQLIERISVPYDGRLKKLVLTPRARELSALMEEDRQMIEERIEKGITPEEKKIFYAVLDKIKGNLLD